MAVAPSIDQVAGFDAIVLAGGASRRLGGVDKATVEIGGATMLARVLEAVSGAGQVVVVGPHRRVASSPQGDRLHARCEEPAGSGPVAALAAGLEDVEAPVVAVLACDLPLLSRQWVERLATRAASEPADGVVPVDQQGQRQPLCAAYRSAALRGAVVDLAEVAGASMRQVLNRLTVTEVPADAEHAWDCDTWDDVAWARKFLEDR